MLLDSYINIRFPRTIRAKLVAPISRAYKAVEVLKAENPILNGPMSCNFISNLRQALVEQEIMRMINNGLIPGLECRVSNNIRNTHPFLEIYGPSFVATINQVPKLTSFPIDAHYRNQRAATNQLSFFAEDNREPDNVYFIITHGYNCPKPDFICIGIPAPNGKFWVQRINIMNEPFVIFTGEDEEKSLISLTEFAKEVLKNESKKDK